MGTLAGAGLGGLAGATLFDGNARIAGAAAGTLLGAFLGNEAGKSLDRADAAYASRAEAQALEYAPAGSATPWRNPDSGSYGAVTPVQHLGDRRRLLPRVPAQGQDRRPQRAGLRHRLPQRRRRLAGDQLGQPKSAGIDFPDRGAKPGGERIAGLLTAWSIAAGSVPRNTIVEPGPEGRKNG